MLIYEVESGTPEFRYKIWFGRNGNFWSIDNVQVIFRNEPLLPKRRIAGTFASEVDVIERAVTWCDTMVNHLLYSDVPLPELLPATEITIDQLPGLEKDKGAA